MSNENEIITNEAMPEKWVNLEDIAEHFKTGTPPPRQQIINNPLFISQTGDNSNVIPNYGTMNLTLGKHGGGSNE